MNKSCTAQQRNWWSTYAYIVKLGVQSPAIKVYSLFQIEVDLWYSLLRHTSTPTAIFHNSTPKIEANNVPSVCSRTCKGTETFLIEVLFYFGRMNKWMILQLRTINKGKTCKGSHGKDWTTLGTSTAIWGWKNTRTIRASLGHTVDWKRWEPYGFASS